MANVSAWTRAHPSGASLLKDFDDLYRSDKSLFEASILEEHYWKDGSAASGGRHKPGSARIYSGASSAVSSTGESGRLMWDETNAQLVALHASGSSRVPSYAAVGSWSTGHTFPRIDIVQNHNAPTKIQISNTDPGTGGQAEFRVTNGTGSGDFFISGMGFTDGSNFGPNEVGVVAESTASGIHLRSNANTYIRFSVGIAPEEIGRFTLNGFGIGTTEPAVPLDVRADNDGYAADIRNSSLTGGGVSIAGGSGDGVALAVNNYNSGSVLLRCLANGSLLQGHGAVTSTATNGFLYIATVAGTPTGTPTASTGRVPMLYDTTANKLWIYNGAWRSATFA